MIFLKQTCRAVGYQMDLPVLQKNNIFRPTSWNFPNLKTCIQNEQTMEVDCKKEAKTVCTLSQSYV